MTIKNHIVMMGPPGSGKGTQAQILQARLGIPTYSVGEMLRRVSAEDTELGRKVKALIDKGSLVPDEVSSEIVAHTMKTRDVHEKGFILDGFPRSLGQAEALTHILEEEGLSLDVVLLLEVPDNFIEERIIGRYACARCGSMYHGKFNPPKAGDACDVCGGKEFVRRADDNLETVQKRLEIYRAVTMPVIPYYEEKGLLVSVDGSGPINVVSEKIKKVVGG